MKKDNKKILFAAQDPGGFNSIINIIKRLKGFETKVLLAGESRKIAKANKIQFTDCEKNNKKDIEGIINKLNPDLIFTATSMGLSLEKKVLEIVNKKKIKSIAFVDYWSNYKIRFSSRDKIEKKYLAEKILVIDGFMKKQMIKEGFDKDRLIITGNPYFDDIKFIKSDKEKYILFASQPFAELFSIKSKKTAKYSAFDEVKIFSDIVKALEAAKSKLPAVISFHPRERKRDKYDKIISNSKLDIRIANKNTVSLFKQAKAVIGINSMVLFQAALAGKKVISYQPGLNKSNDPLIPNHLGLSQPVYNYKRLENIFKKEIKDKVVNKKIVDKYINNNSTQKIIKEINNSLK